MEPLIHNKETTQNKDNSLLQEKILYCNTFSNLSRKTQNNKRIT